ncbi:MAG: radical SAM protein [Thermodesulfobacteriota bacterium]|nr:radical SAM protein [Thermodesulfobacteriota bacterium]
MTPSLLLINPWIYDFAAYDLWSKPLGLLYLAGSLRHCGFTIHLIDCLDVHHPAMSGDPAMQTPTRRLYGTGKFWRQKARRPLPLKDIQRPYSRYGLSNKAFQEALKAIRDPAAILVTSLMTYWYPGVKEAISLAKQIHPRTPVILGGIYAKLCHDHAMLNSGADRIVTDSDPFSVLRVLDDCGIPVPGRIPPMHCRPYPAFDLLGRIDYVCLLTSVGCPYRCRYCASHFLNPDPIKRDPREVLDEVLFWHKDYGICDFAFYDDALLLESYKHLAVLLEDLVRRGLKIRFHTPNALHVKEITPGIARIMYQAGFRTIRLGLETSNFGPLRDLDNKLDKGDFERAVRVLLEAGFTGEQTGAYIMIGLPGQSADSVIETIESVAEAGIAPYLSEYSPIPHTALWNEAVSLSEYDLVSEPLFHNNTLLPCWDDSQKKELPRLKKRISEIREKLRSGR